MAKKTLKRAKSKTKKVFDPHKFEKNISEKSTFYVKPTIQNTTTMIVYVGMANKARRIGSNTGKVYEFNKDENQKPIPVGVDNIDLPALLQERGKGCWRIEPSALFILKEEWEKNCN